MKRIAAYEILGLLGKGGMARVYKVRHAASGRILALKLLMPHEHLQSLLGWETIVEHFNREADVMLAINHPHVVKALDHGSHDDRPFIVMEYYCHNVGEVIGETYRLENPSRPLRPEQAIRHARETLHGLAGLHAAGIIHRDIKPFNLLLDDREAIKITDFGLSKLRGEIFAHPPQLIVGSPYYAAPEQQQDANAVDCRADLYAVAVMLYRMLTGWLPVDDEAQQTAASTRNPELGPQWDRFFSRSISAEPADRHNSAADMRRDLELLEREWEKVISRYCRGFERAAPATRQKTARARGKPRNAPHKIRPQEALQAFSLDRLWRPVEPVTTAFRDPGDGTVVDPVTTLVWQKSGSQDGMTWKQAREYVDSLNRIGFAGITTWRLPTVEELLSILTLPTDKDNYCIPAVFDQSRKWLWSCDRASFTAAWYVSVNLGYVARQDFTCRFYVRAVSSASP